MSVTLHCGDCLDILPTLAAGSVDSIICDPPAAISFMGKEWDSNKGGRVQWIAWLTQVMAECLRVSKPGGMAIVWSIPRTSHWTGTALEEAGWEVRDVITHLFGTGFPKSHQFHKQMNGDGEAWRGYGTALKPAAEFWWLAMKPLDKNFAHNALTHGVAGLNVDACRIGTDEIGKVREKDVARMKMPDWRMTGGSTGGGASNPNGRWPANLILNEESAALLDEASGGLHGRGNKKPERQGSRPGQNVYGTYAGRVVPALDHGDMGGASRFFYVAKAARAERNEGLAGMEERTANSTGWSGEGMPLRQDGTERKTVLAQNFHPTVKPLSLMRYLCRLTKTPFGGTVLDPFMGSGTTGAAAVMEGRSFVGIEIDPEYFALAEKRIDRASWQPLLLEVM